MFTHGDDQRLVWRHKSDNGSFVVPEVHHAQAIHGVTGHSVIHRPATTAPQLDGWAGHLDLEHQLRLAESITGHTPGSDFMRIAVSPSSHALDKHVGLCQLLVFQAIPHVFS